MPIIPRKEQPWDLVCACCGSDDLRIADSHGWMRCEDCGQTDYAVARVEFEQEQKADA